MTKTRDLCPVCKAPAIIYGGVTKHCISDYDKLHSAALKLVTALNHPDIENLDCDCGYYDEHEHTCVKHYIEVTLREWEKEMKCDKS